MELTLPIDAFCKPIEKLVANALANRLLYLTGLPEQSTIGLRSNQTKISYFDKHQV